MDSEELKSTIQAEEIESEIKTAFMAWKGANNQDVRTVYEHGQWWVLWDAGAETGDDDEPVCTYSVVDATGPGSIDGYSFELMP